MARLRRTRWQLTLLVTVVTALCITVLSLVVLYLDGRSRAAARDATLERMVTGLAPRVFLDDDGALDTADLGDDALLGGRIAVAVVAPDGAGGWEVRFGHLRSGLPGPIGLAATADAAFGSPGAAIYRDDTDTAGRSVRLAAEVFAFDDSDQVAVLVAGTDPGAWDRDRALLLWALTVGGLALVAVAAGSGHALSGRSMRQAVDMLDEQERFLGDAAHELRTPLTTLGLVAGPRRRDPAAAERALAEVRVLGARMERIVAGLLVRSRIRAGTATAERVRLLLDQLVESVAEEFGGAAVLELRTEPTVVVGDPELLALAVRNLIENAITHGALDPRAPVLVQVAGGQVLVRDHGPGPEPGVSSDPFGRGVSGGRGSGIGLALVAWIAELHGGVASLEPAAGGGTIAVLRLPPPLSGPAPSGPVFSAAGRHPGAGR